MQSQWFEEGGLWEERGIWPGLLFLPYKELRTPFNIIYIMRSCGSDFETVSSFRFEV